jgi:hypothetical protein
VGAGSSIIRLADGARSLDSFAGPGFISVTVRLLNATGLDSLIVFFFQRQLLSAAIQWLAEDTEFDQDHFGK